MLVFAMPMLHVTLRYSSASSLRFSRPFEVHSFLPVSSLTKSLSHPFCLFSPTYNQVVEVGPFVMKSWDESYDMTVDAAGVSYKFTSAHVFLDGDQTFTGVGTGGLTETATYASKVRLAPPLEVYSELLAMSFSPPDARLANPYPTLIP